MSSRRIVVEQEAGGGRWFAYFANIPRVLFKGSSLALALLRLTDDIRDLGNYRFEIVTGSEEEGRIEMDLVPIVSVVCPECRGSKVYVGLISVEPCLACGGTGTSGESPEKASIAPVDPF